MNTMDMIQKRRPHKVLSLHICVFCMQDGEFENHIMIHHMVPLYLKDEYFLAMPSQIKDFINQWKAVSWGLLEEFYELLYCMEYYGGFGKKEIEEYLKDGGENG